MTSSLLDRVISYLSPTRGAERLAARQMMATLLSYEGARVGRREAGWMTGSLSANAEISGDRVTLRNRVRSLIRDDAYAVKALEALVVNRIGTGILTTADGPNGRLNERLQQIWKRWIDRCDYTGRTDYYGLQALAERCRIESGEAFIRFVTVNDEDDPDGIPLRLQVLEPDHLDTTKNERRSGNREIIEGIEYEGGQPVAYWLFPQHPGDSFAVLPMSLKSERVPARQVIHYYRPLRPGQLSGVTEFSPVIRELHDLKGYADAELMRKKIAACSVGVVTTPGGLPASSLAPTGTDSTGRRTESFAPGMWHYTKPGENVQFFDPKPSGGYAEFFNVHGHRVSCGMKVPYELVTGDFSQVNWTSFRASLVQFKAMIEADQWQLVIPQVCQPIWNRFVSFAEAKTVRAKFTPPRFGLLDPAKEVPAMVEAIQGGLRSWSDTIRREGYEPSEVIDEIEAERREFARRGIELTCFESQAAGPKAPTPPDDPPAPSDVPDGEPDEEEEQAAA